jgi:3-methyladenine DNA glycosylase AlkD
LTSEAPATAAGFALAPHACFACGELNEHGLHLDLHIEADTCWTELEIPAAFQGWEDVVHGGIVATILDEVMAWSLASSDTWGFTARMTVTYRRPVTVGRRIRAEGWLVARRRRALTTAGRLVDAETRVELAAAEGFYVAAPEERRRELKARYGYAERRARAGLPESVDGRTLPLSPVTQAAAAIIAERRPAAAALGRRLAGLADDPDTLVDALRDGFIALADPAYREGVTATAPGIDGVLGVRSPLRDETARRFREATRGVSPDTLLRLGDRLARAPEPELRWFAIGLLRRVLPADQERAWQILRRLAHEAGEWITVDTLAGVCARGILAEPFRWAEVDQLVYSPSRWERRLVGSTVAVMPFEDRVAGRSPEVAARGLDLVGSLIGDAEPDVARSLAWALRSLAVVDQRAVVIFCHEQAELARATGDGHRAWVVRDALAKLPAADARVLRTRLAGIRRTPHAPSTSRAAAAALACVQPGADPARVAGDPGPAEAPRRAPRAPAS